MKGILERLRKGEVLLADGATGTMLQQRGLKLGACPESFNLQRPEVLEEIAALYLKAGADIIHTNTFGGSPLKLSSYGLDEKAEEINAAAVGAVRRAAGERAYVAASIGPSGRLLKPFGDTEPEELSESFERQIKSLIGAGVDMLTMETMTDLAEATLAVKAARAVSSGVPVMATMTFDSTPKGFRTIMGVSIEDACAGLEEAGADVVGSNCGNGIELMVEIARVFRKNTRLPIAVQANAGIPEMKGGKPVYKESPRFMAEKAKELISVGVSIIGGCCGTTPEHIQALREMIDSRTDR